MWFKEPQVIGYANVVPTAEADVPAVWLVHVAKYVSRKALMHNKNGSAFRRYRLLLSVSVNIVSDHF